MRMPEVIAQIWEINHRNRRINISVVGQSANKVWGENALYGEYEGRNATIPIT